MLYQVSLRTVSRFPVFDLFVCSLDYVFTLNPRGTCI
nr:MAG TPA: hypothetical protein [Bacteriophage sp.]